jgi:hypothetical protein
MLKMAKRDFWTGFTAWN